MEGLEGMNVYRFGTVAGYHTAAELKDLIAAYDATLHNLVMRVDEIKDLPLDLTSFTPAYENLLNRYGTARNIAQTAVDKATGSWRPLNMVITENEWKGLLSSLNPRWQEYTWSNGDGSVYDLYDQVNKFGATGVNDQPIPQPTPGSDVDFNALTAATQFTHSIESSLDTKHLLLYAVIGGALALFVLPRLMNPAMLLKH